MLDPWGTGSLPHRREPMCEEAWLPLQVKSLPCPQAHTHRLIGIYSLRKTQNQAQLTRVASKTRIPKEVWETETDIMSVTGQRVLRMEAECG